MIFESIKINGIWLPKPDGNMKFSAEKIKKEHVTEAGTMMVNVVRPSKLSISGSWTLSGHWVKRFREWREADMVMVSAYYPDPEEMSDYMCQFEIDSENHVMDARKQIPESGGIYQISVSIVEL